MKTTNHIANAILAALILVVVAAPASAAVPEAVTYAGTLSQGAAPADGTFSAVFDVFDAAEGGARVFEQVEPTLAVSAGELVVDLGRDPSNTLDDDVLAGGNLFLQITLNGEVLEPRVPFTSVPYARRAAVAESAETADVADLAADADRLQGLTPADILAQVSAGAGLTKVGNDFRVAPGGITGAHVAFNSITGDKLVNGAITDAKIQNGTITKEKVRGGVLVVQALPACGSSLMLTGGAPLFCTSIVCGTHRNSYLTNNEDVAPTFFNCAGTCNQNAPQQCRVSGSAIGVLIPN